jgi:hypothetical protein
MSERFAAAPGPDRPGGGALWGVSEGGSHTQWGGYNLIDGQLNGNRSHERKVIFTPPPFFVWRIAHEIYRGACK